MKVRSTAVLEATQITEEMVRSPELLPAGVVFGRRSVAGDGRLISYTLRAETDAAGDYGSEFVHVGQWYVANEDFSAVVDDCDFRQQYEEAEVEPKEVKGER